MKKYLVLFIAVFFVHNLVAQDLSNKGKDFWVGYGNHVRMFNAGGAESMQIYLTSDVNTTGSVIFTSGTASIPFTVTANLITVVNIPRTEFLPDEGLYSRGIHITAVKPIVAYGFIYVSAISGATVYLPTNTLGKDYYSLNYKQLSNENNCYSYFFVEAVEPGTTIVEITPSQTTKGGWAAGITQTIPLTQGQIYQVLSSTDLTGSTIKSIATGTDGCKKIAVFCGSGKISTGCSPVTAPTAAVGSSDNLYQQMYPYSTWGKKYILIPSNNTPSPTGGNPNPTPNINTNIFRIFRPDATTIVTVNGATIPGASFTNNYYDFQSNQTGIVNADKPILVAQYFTTANSTGPGGCPSGNGNPHDPEMIYLNPVEQVLSDVTVNSMQPAANTAITQHFINVVLRNGGTGISSFKIDGVNPPITAFNVLPQDNNYSFLRIWKQGGSTTALSPALASGAHRLTCDSGFNAISYGFGSAESYGYSAGTNLRDFNKSLEIQSQYGIINNGTANSCTNSPFRFNIYLPDSSLSNSGPTSGTNVAIRFDSIRWEVTGPGVFNPNNFPVLKLGDSLYAFPNAGMKVRPDSLRVRNGKPVAWYSLPTQYSLVTPGIYTITVTGYRTNTNDGCASGNEIEYEFNLNVSGPPPATFSYNQPGCPADSVRFLETTPQGPVPIYPTYHFWWSFGDPASGVLNNTSNLRNPIHKFSSPGTYRVRFANITTPGCLSDTSFDYVVVPNLVTASISGTTVVCQNSTPNPNVSFTITSGLAPYRIKYTLSTNGGVPVVQPDIITSALVNTIPAPTGVAGTFAYAISSVENADAAYCTVPITGQVATVTVNPTPTATVAGTTNVCQNSPAQTITFTGTNGSTPTTIYQFTYIATINGVLGVAQTINSNAVGIATISLPTTTPGTYKYDLLSVKDNGTTCSNTLTAGATTTATVFVQAKPTGTVATNNAVVCQDATAPTIVFTGSGANGQAPYTFTYTVTTNGIVGALQTISTLSTSNSTAPITVPMVTNGTLVYTLLSVQNSGATNCTTTYSVVTAPSTSVAINPVPTATITGNATVCQAAGPQTVNLIGAGGTTPSYVFNYTISTNGGPAVAQAVAGNNVVLSQPANVGVYVYEIVSVKDAVTNCIRNYSSPRPSVTVTIQPTSTATISGTTTVCQDATAPSVNFTAANGIAPFTFTYTLTTNGVIGASQTISTPTLTPNAATFQIPMTTAGTLIYTLTNVKNNGSLNCATPITGQTATFTINPIPTATINIAGTNAITVCQNTGTQPITFTGFGGTGGAGAVYVFNYTISTNGGAPVAQPALTGNSMVINQASTAFTVYTYVITSVKDNATGCTKTYTTNPPTVVFTVKQLATANMATSAATVCQASTTLPVITFTALGGAAPYKFTYTITTNGVTGAVQTTPFTTSGSSYPLPVPTAIAGTYIYTLVSVQESSSVACVNAQTGSTQVIVHPQPTASFTAAAPFCALKDVTFTPAPPTGAAIITSWVWNYDNGTGQQIRTDNNPFTINYATAGVKNVTFKTVSDKGCESVLYMSPVTINGKPKAGFKSPEACLADAFAQFTDPSTVVGGSIVFWEWDFGDPGSPTNLVSGSGPAQQNPLHAYAAVGLKTVKLIVTTNAGCKDTVPAQSFYINGEVTSANFISQNGGNFCSNRPVQIKENSVVNVGGLIRVDIYWDNLTAPSVFELDDFPTPNKIYTHNYPNLQIDKTYQIRYVAYSGFNGLCQKEITKIITVHGSPIAIFDPPIKVCLNGGPIPLSGTVTVLGGLGGTTVFMGTGVSPTGIFDPLTVGPGITDTITFTAISPNNCDSAIKKPIHVLIPPVANFITTGNLCVGGPSNANVVTFHQTSTVTAGEGGAIVKWIYDWGDGTPIQTFTSGADVTHVYNTAGSKIAKLIVEDAFGCRNAPAKQHSFTVNPLPVPSYSPSTSACLPSATIVFTNNTPGPLSNYLFNWSFDLPSTAAGNISTQPTPSHVYTTQGPFNTQLIATVIATGCKDSTAIIPIGSSTIHPAPVLRFDVIPDVCLNNGIKSFLLLARETSGIAGGPGLFSGPGIISANGDFNPLLAGVGTHNITYTWTSTFGCPTSITRQVKVLAAPVVNTFTTVGNICEQNGTVFHNTTAQGAGTIVTWVYDWADGSPLQFVNNGNDITHFYASFGTYDVTLYVITNDGCKSVVKHLNLVVNALPKPRFNFTPVACLPQAKIDFTNTTPQQSIGSLVYYWVFDNVPPSIKTTVNTDFTYTVLGSHPVKLIAINTTTFCKDSSTQDIMNSLHPAPTASFNFNKPSVCIGDNVKVIDGPSNPADGTMTGWSWNYGDNAALFSGQIQNPHTYTSDSTFNVKLIVTNSFGCVDDTTRAFTVHPFPTANAGRDSIILEGGNIVLTPTVTGNDLRYLWTGTPAPINLNSDTIKNPLASPVNDITYALLVTGRGGCKAPLDYVFIKVLKFPVIPNTFTPNNDGVHDTWVIKYLESYPDARVQIFTRTGQLIYESRRYTKPWDGTMNGKSLPFDTYYYILEPGTGRAPITGYVTIVK
jgi:gliding motility-associated-like protein